MNVRMVFYHIGQILRVIAVFLVVPLFTSLVCGELTVRLTCAYIVPMLVCLGVGFVLTRSRPADVSFYAREGLLIVGFSWIIISLLGALPFAIGTYGNENFADLTYVDWLFESVSGFTTTGSSVLHATGEGHQIDLMYDLGYKGLLMWRSLTHWLGGMGVLVFVLAVLPSSNASGIHILQAESSGPSVGKIVSRMSGTARILYVIYTAMTLVEILLLVIGSAFDGQMNFFHAVILSMGTAGTGGFAATSGSVGDFGLYVQIVVMVFMFLFGINFNLYYMLLIGKALDVFRREELRFYFITVVAAVVLVTLNVRLSMGDSLTYSATFWTTLQYSSFSVIASVTSAGFCTVDFTVWPAFSRVLLMFLMFMGANAGSTSGGFKCTRFLILIKSVFVRCRKVLNPRAVYSVKMDGKKLDDDIVRGVDGYFAVYMLILLAATLIIGLDFAALPPDEPVLTAFSSVLTCINGVGPGMTGAVGPNGDFFLFAPWGKLTLSLVMLFGRLEIYPILMLFSPQTYSRT